MLTSINQLSFEFPPGYEPPPGYNRSFRHWELGRSAVVKDNIWCLSGFRRRDTNGTPKYQIQFIIIDTGIYLEVDMENRDNLETNGMTKRVVDIPRDGIRLGQVECHDNYLWIVMYHHYNTRINELWKFDTKTMSVVEEFVFERGNDWISSVHFHGNEMYFMDGLYFKLEELYLNLKVFDLSTKLIKGSYPMAIGQGYPEILVNNDKLYLVVTYDRTCKREVYWISEHFLKQRISDDSYANFAIASRNNMMCSECKPYVCNDQLVIHQYDFTKNHWDQKIFEDYYKNESYLALFITSLKRVIDKIYIFSCRFMEEEPNVSLRVFDVKPKLGDICLSNLTKKILAEKDKAEEIKEQIPFNMRQTMVAMAKCHIPDFSFATNSSS